MEVIVDINKKVKIKTLAIAAKIKDWSESIINNVEDAKGTLTPCRIDNFWKPVIDINTGIIKNWVQGVKAEVCFKVIDGGSYYLNDEDGNIVLSIEKGYVPKIACPKEEGYGDYIIMDIDENGKIADWVQNINDFFK